MRYADDREGMRRLGENAMNGIYIPWQASVEHALVRYREVLMAASSEEPHNSESVRENFFGFVRDIYERNEEIRELGELLLETRDEVQEKFEEKMDRYL